jgi:phosphomannomutase
MTIDNYLFDMDGTLTKSRSRISTNMLDLLRSLASQGSNKLYLVTGSDLTKVEEQIPYDALGAIFDLVFCSNGTRVYDYSPDPDNELGSQEPELIHSVSLLDHYSQEDINHIVSVLSRLAANTHTKYKTGTFVEWRGSQINFSVIGRDCSLEQRENYVKWDKKSGERNKIMQKLREEFDGWGLSFRLGGQISIDITRSGWDKSYALKHIPANPKKCVYFGDRIDYNGNDSDVAALCGRHHQVSGPEETEEIIRSIYLQGGK